MFWRSSYVCYYAAAQLRNSLPKLIVDIVEEKLEREYCVGAVSLLMHVNKATQRTPDETIDSAIKVSMLYAVTTQNHYFHFFLLFLHLAVYTCVHYQDFQDKRFAVLSAW